MLLDPGRQECVGLSRHQAEHLFRSSGMTVGSVTARLRKRDMERHSVLFLRKETMHML